MSVPGYFRETRALLRALAVEYAISYCKAHGLATRKLLQQRFDVVDGDAIFSQPVDVKPEGLCNDLLTMPLPTLMIRVDGGRLRVETTEHTETYLKE